MAVPTTVSTVLQSWGVQCEAALRVVSNLVLQIAHAVKSAAILQVGMVQHAVGFCCEFLAIPFSTDLVSPHRLSPFTKRPPPFRVEIPRRRSRTTVDLQLRLQTIEYDPCNSCLPATITVHPLRLDPDWQLPFQLEPLHLLLLTVHRV